MTTTVPVTVMRRYNLIRRSISLLGPPISPLRFRNSVVPCFQRQAAWMHIWGAGNEGKRTGGAILAQRLCTLLETRDYRDYRGLWGTMGGLWVGTPLWEQGRGARPPRTPDTQKAKMTHASTQTHTETRRHNERASMTADAANLDGLRSKAIERGLNLLLVELTEHRAGTSTEKLKRHGASRVRSRRELDRGAGGRDRYMAQCGHPNRKLWGQRSSPTGVVSL